MVQGTNVLINLGSNFGDRRQNLYDGIQQIQQLDFSVNKISPVVESPALLPTGSPSEWNRPFLNVNLHGVGNLGVDAFYRSTKKIQKEYKRYCASNYSPRSLDIDIIAWGDEVVSLNGKELPNSSLHTKSFVMSPLVHTAPEFEFVNANKTAFEISCSQSLPYHIPLWMGIVNVTPDSFSGNKGDFELTKIQATVEKMISSGVNIIDVGAESTRPNATPLSAEQEWKRLAGVLEVVKESLSKSLFPPRLSIDTYHPETVEKALKVGIDMVNDVSGLSSGKMISLVRESNVEVVAMHSVTVPVDPMVSIDDSKDAVEFYEKWLRIQQDRWSQAKLNLDRIIVDPGIGFGKSSLQALDLMRSISRIRKLGQRVLIGHSRKRFLKSFAQRESSDLDMETVATSLHMSSQNVDILRVHDVESHTRAYLSYAHLLNQRIELE